MLDYLQASGYTSAYEALKRESGVEDDPKQKGVLEKKWASIVRLQRKVRLWMLSILAFSPLRILFCSILYAPALLGAVALDFTSDANDLQFWPYLYAEDQRLGSKSDTVRIRENEWKSRRRFG